MKKSIRFLIAVLFLLNFTPNYASGEEILSWRDCVKEAAKNHPDLISAKEVINQSKANKNITESGLGPQITGDLGTTYSNTPSGNSKTSTSNQYSATGTQLIFDGFKTIDETMAAKETIKSSQFAYKFTSSEVRLRLRAAYIDLLRAQDLIKINKEIYDIRKKNLELIKLHYESGLEHKGALLTAEANLAQAEYGIKQAERNREVSQTQLMKEMGRSQFIPMVVIGDYAVKEPTAVKPDLMMLVEKNPSLLQLSAEARAAYFNVRSAKANFFPTISASGTAGRQDSRWLPQTNQWNMGLSLSLPIFESGLKVAQVSLAKAQFNEAEANERSTKDSIIVSLEQAWQALQDAIDIVGVQKKFLTADEERSKIANAQYSVGFITFDNWTIIEDNLVKSKSSYLDAQASTLLAEASWIKAKGETLEYEE